MATATVDARRREAEDLMAAFAERTGLASGRSTRRYLWTDAFAVCNLLGLGHTSLALRLVEQVHATLGRHRPDDPRRGWISGLDEITGAAHPTLGGLRIGKPLPERGPHEPFDEHLEWERDGQYFHYLTRWMHALDQVTRTTGEARYRAWARELAETAHLRFVHAPRAGARRIYWKMSVDLSRPQVASMGQHDPLDGLVTSVQLGLDAQAADYAAIGEDLSYATDDPLGLGGLLVAAHQADVLAARGAARLAGLGHALRAAARIGLRHVVERPGHGERLAFRELGLAIGLAAALPDAPLRADLEAHWRRPEHRRTAAYLAHQDINDVMLATALCPDGYLRS